MKFKKHYYAVAVLFYLISISIIVFINYQTVKTDLYKEIDKKLKNAALTTINILPHDFHNRTFTSTSVTKETYQNNMDLLSGESKILEVKFVYTLIKKGSNIYFTSANASDEEIKTNSATPYFELYSDAPPELSEAFDKNKITYAQYSDRWGTFRSVFIPNVTKDGYSYVTAADVEIGYIETILQKELISSFEEIFIHMLILLPLFFLYSRQMREIKNDLEQTVLKRTKELEASKEMAEESLKTKSEFLAMMSHEIRTPMNGILGMLALIERSELDKIQKHYLQIAKNSANSLLILINDILDFSKIEAGKMQIEPIEFDLAVMLEELIEFMSFRAKEKGILLLLDDKTMLTKNIIADEGRIRQILTNLISNAIKFTHYGEVKLTVLYESFNNTGGAVSFVVSDTGIGIAQNKIDSLFDPFTQADGSTTRKYGGTGLGLSIVKNLCRLMSGDIGVTSTLGVGSTFTAQIQVLMGAEILKRDLDNQEADDSDIQWPLKTRILLVEDNPTNQIVAQGLLVAIGLEADIAGNGLEALEAVSMATNILPYSIILMDCQMPEMDGYEATKAIRAGEAGEKNRSIPIVAMTANAMDQDKQQCIASGMDDYIAKPVNIEALAAVLKKWLLKKDEEMQDNNTEQEETQATMIWDRAGTLERFGGKEKLLGLVVNSFLADVPMQIQSLSLALKENNPKNAQLHAHSIKGTAGNVGALALQEIARKMEFAAKDNNLEAIKELYPEFKECYKTTTAVLAKEIENN